MRTALVYNFLLEANLMASLAIVLLLPVRKCFRKFLGNRVICFAWLLVAVRLLCPLALPNPLMNEIRSPYAADEAIRPMAGQVKVRLNDALSSAYSQTWRAARENGQSAETPALETLNALRHSMDNGMLPQRLMQLYLAGCAGVAAWFVLANVRFRRRLRADRIGPLSGELLEQYQALCARRGMKPLPVYYVDPLPSACLVGVVRPYIALPLSAAPQDVLPVLTHEICHAKGRDHWLGAVRLCCCVVHWFNPLVWLAASLSRTDGELLCDDRVIRGMQPEEKRAYAGVLVLAAARRCAPGVPVLATGMTMTGRKLKKRVQGILSDRRPLRALSILFASLCTLLLAAAFATAEYFPTYSLADIPAYQAIHSPLSPVESDDDAIKRVQAIADLPPISGGMKNAVWTVDHAGEPETDFRVMGTRPDGTRLTALVSPDGRINSLISGDFSWIDSEEAERTDPDAPWRQELISYVKAFAEDMSPGITEKMTGFRLYNDRVDKNQHRYVVVEAPLSPERTIGFVVQVAPTLRIVEYSPGNG